MILNADLLKLRAFTKVMVVVMVVVQLATAISGTLASFYFAEIGTS